MNLIGNKILITGATNGIGKALALKFIQLGNSVIAVGRDQSRLKILSEISERIIPFKCDVANQNQLDELIVFIEQNHSDTNILINNAGIQYNYNLEEEKDILARIEYEITVNFTAPLKLIALMMPVLKANNNAAIVNVSSGLALVPKMTAPVYCGTKAGIHIFTKALRYQNHKIKVFEIIPPLVDTAMTKGRGKNKMQVEKLVEEFVKRFKDDIFEINIGKVKLLRLLNRISPRLAESIMKKF